MSFSGEVAWVTGSSKGIGRATCLGFAERGCDVVVHYGGSREEAEEVAGEVEKRGRDALLVQGDVSDSGEVKRMVGEIEDYYGRLDIVVNNAGSFVNRLTLAEMTEDRLGPGHGGEPQVGLPVLSGGLAHDEAAGRGQDRQHDLHLGQERR